MDSIFHDIVGHDGVKKGLMHAAATGRLHHALLFSGPSGTGRAMLARAFVQAMFCEQTRGGALARCGTCRNCHRIRSRNHPDVIDIEVATPTLKIEVIRELQSRLLYAPVESARRFVIVQDVHKMQDAASNCFLKTLEEPPAGTTFILLTDQIQRLIPTIISRCQVVRFAPFSVQEVADFMKARGASPDEAARIAAMSDGSLGQAVELSASDDSNDVLAAFEEITSTASMLDAFSTAAALKGRKDRYDALLKLMTMYVRDMLILKTSPDTPLMLPPYRAQMASRLPKTSEKQLFRAANIIQEVTESFQGNGNELLAWERLMLGMHSVIY